MKNLYKKICQKLSRKGCSFRLRWISRESNKSAHKYAYAALQKVKEKNIKNQILLIEKKSFIEILKKFNKSQIEIIIYLFNSSKFTKIIFKKIF